MSRKKSTPDSAPKPQVVNGYIQKNELDAWLDRYLPIPTQVISNEEFVPPPQSAEQKKVEHNLLALADVQARKLGMSRRDFLRTSCGMAAAFLAMNSVYGELFSVEAGELLDPNAAAAAEKYFVFDVQTHHVATGKVVTEGTPYGTEYFLDIRKFGTNLTDSYKLEDIDLNDLYLENYIKEVFLDSETDVACVTGIPALAEEHAVLSAEDMYHTKTWINDFTKSKRVVAHGLFSPELGKRNLESMQAQVEKLKIDAWKGYTGQKMGPNGDGWWLDDEKVAYPALEQSRKLGVKNICLHKGLPLPQSNQEKFGPRDVVKASKDFPDLNFLLYHSGFKGGAKVALESDFKVTDIPWTSDLCEWRKKNPHMKNVYMELGSTFGLWVVTDPRLAAFALGMIIDAFGDDHVLWGTDSIWWGSPQWQIEAFKRLQMPEDLTKRFGYKPLTREVKQKILGFNGAKLYNIDPKSKLGEIPNDFIDRLRKKYKQAGGVPSNTQFGWVPA